MYRQSSRGGDRPIVDESDGRLHPNRVLETADPSRSHHILAPGSWMPHARVLEPEDELIYAPWERKIVTLRHLETMPDEDLIPSERLWLAHAHSDLGS